MRLIFNKLSRLQISGIFIAIGIFLITLVITFYYEEKQLIEKKNYNTLESVAELKAEQISQWYKDRIAEATYYSTDLPLTRIDSSNFRIDYSELNSSLLKVMQDHRYENIMLTDTGGRMLFSVMEFYQQDAGAVSSVRKCLKTGNVVVNDFYYCSTHKKVHFDITAPVYSAPRGTASRGNIIALLIFRIDPHTYLYPMINVWPGQNKTVETVIARKSGSKVVLLNKLLKQSGQPMDFTITGNLINLPVVQAVNGTRGRFMGVDYLGVKVMADLRQIQDTPWSMVVKMNISELYRELYIKAAAVLTVIILLVMSMMVIYARIKNRLMMEARQALIKAKEKAEESNRLKTAFLANMSHEIRTPMNGILGFLNLLKETDLSAEEKDEYLNLMNISGQRLLNTINDIIEISKIETGKLESKTSEIDLTEVFRFYVDFFRPEAELKNIRLCLGRQVEAGSAHILGDRHKLDGILTNLVKNAIKFTDSGTIELNSALGGDNLLIWVKDTGIGIPAHQHQAIFERFIQADTSFARRHEGSGLGLAIVKAYADILGGTVWVESEEGKGSTFFVRIPYIKGTVLPASANGHASHPQSSHSNNTILIAEDDDVSFTLMKSYLKVTGLTILRAVNGRECIDLVKSSPGICLVLMDIKMPGIDGYEATRIIRQINKQLPVIAQTANALEGDSDLALTAGCNEYLTKPVSKETLIRVVEKYVEKFKEPAA